MDCFVAPLPQDDTRTGGRGSISAPFAALAEASAAFSLTPTRRRFQLILILEHATLCKCPTASSKESLISPPNYWFCSTLLCHSLRSSTLSFTFFLLLLCCVDTFVPLFCQLNFDCHTARRRLRKTKTKNVRQHRQTVSHESRLCFTSFSVRQHYLALFLLIVSPLELPLVDPSRSKLKLWPLSFRDDCK